MSAAPDLGTILAIVSNLDQGLQAKLPPETLLKQFLPAISLPQTRFVRVYRLSDNKAVLQASSDDERPAGTYIPVSTPIYAQALQSLSSAQDGNSGLWVAPLHSTGTTFGFLEVGLEGAATTELDSALQLIGHHLSQALYTATMRDLVQRQANASTELTRCTTFTEMAGVIAAHMLGGGQFISIDLVDYNENDKVTGMRVIASANRHQSFDAVESVPLSMEDLGEPLNRLFDSAEPVQVSDVASNGSMSVAFRKWLTSHKVEALCCLPMRYSGQTFGVLVINSTNGPLYLSEDELRVYQSLVDQVSALVQVHHLVKETSHSQEISERQALAFAELTSSQNFEEMAGVIARHMLPTHGRFLVLSSLQYDAAGELTGLRMLASANRERTFAYDSTEMPFSFSGLSAEVRQMLRDGVPQISEISAESPESLGEEFYQYLESNDVQHYMNLPLRVENRPVGLLSVLSKQAPFSKDEINAFHNLADQVAALIYTRNLLAQTSDSLQQTQILYDVNRSILAAQDTLDVLRALRTYLAPEASNISHLTVGYDANQKNFASITVTHILTPEHEQVVQLSLDEMLGPAKLAALETYWNRQGSRLSIVEDKPDTHHPLYEFMLAQGTQSYIIIPVREGSLLTDMVSISFADARSFDDYTRRIYESLSDQIGIVLQNQRLLQQSQANAAQLGRQVEVLQNINQLTSALSKMQEEKGLFERSSEMLVTMLNVDHCGIVLVDAGEVTGTVVAEHPSETSTTLGLKIPWAGNPLAELVTGEGQSVVVYDVNTDSRLIEGSRQFFQSVGITSCIFVPLKIQERIIGSIGLDIYQNHRQISPEMVEIAEIMSTQVSNALRNIRLLADAQRHAQQLQRIAAFNQSVQATLDMATIFNIGLSESAQMLTLDQMEILLYDPAIGQLRTVARFADGKVQITLQDGALVAVEDTTEGRVWITREFLYLPSETRAPDPRQPNKLEPGSHMLAPLQSHGRILGIVGVICNQPHAYGETDFAVFRQMTDQLAVAIENAEAYTQSQRQARNEALVNDIATRLQRQTDVQSMLDITLNEMGKALGARRARIRLATPADQSEN